MDTKEELDTSTEESVLTAMLVNTNILRRVYPMWQGEMFQGRYLNLIGKWCIDYYEEYKQAPGLAIQDSYIEWAKSGRLEKEVTKRADRFLQNLSDNYARLKKGLNPEHEIDKAGNYFDRVRISNILRKASVEIEHGSIEKAQELLLEGSKRIGLGQNAGKDILSSTKDYQAAFENIQHDDLIHYPDAIGDLFQGCFTRGSFVSLLAPAKYGKSYFLQDIAWRGLRKKCKVVMFQIGDLSENQMFIRLGVRSALIPARADEWPCTVQFPISIHKSEDKKVVVENQERTFKKPCTWQDVDKANKKHKRKFDLRDKAYFRLHTYGNFGITVKEIDSILEGYSQREDWNCDICVIDYADLLAPINKRDSSLEQIDTTWQFLRSISINRHCLVLTATQARREASSKELLGRDDVGNDIRKVNHATAMFGISCTPKEKSRQIRRVNCIVQREGNFTPNKFVFVAGCYPLASPICVSCW